MLCFSQESIRSGLLDFGLVFVPLVGHWPDAVVSLLGHFFAHSSFMGTAPFSDLFVLLFILVSCPLLGIGLAAAMHGFFTIFYRATTAVTCYVPSQQG